MFSKLITKMQAMTWKDWLVVGLWLFTFAMLLAFVIAAALVTKGTTSYDNTLAALGFTFMVSIFSALTTTVVIKYLERKRGAK